MRKHIEKSRIRSSGFINQKTNLQMVNNKVYYRNANKILHENIPSLINN